MQRDLERDLGAIVVPRWGRVVPADGPAPWVVVTDEGIELDVVGRYLREFVARGGSPLSTRSYAFDLLRWWRWLKAIDTEWNRATSTEVKDFVLWLKSTKKWRRHDRTRSAATVGTVNPLTRKQYLDDSPEQNADRFHQGQSDVGDGAHCGTRHIPQLVIL